MRTGMRRRGMRALSAGALVSALAAGTALAMPSANFVGGSHSFVGGGALNSAYDSYTAIAGGFSNKAGVDDGNTETQTFAFVGGGSGNWASGEASTVAGGGGNTAS